MSGNDKVGKALDSIEPHDGAKERMLANIKRKAAEQKQKNPDTEIRALSISHIAKWALPAAACLAAVIVGINTIPLLTASEESSVELVGNPFMTINSADEFEKQLGFAIDAPEGASEVEYAILDGNIADICFTYDENVYRLRASKQSGDFSGLYGDETAAEQLDSPKNAVLTTIGSDDQTFLKLTWTDDGVNYILSDTDGCSEDKIKKIFELIK